MQSGRVSLTILLDLTYHLKSYMFIKDSLSTHRFCTFLSFDIHFLGQGMSS